MLRKELLGYLAKLKRLFGDDIGRFTDASGREVVVGKQVEEDEDDDELVEEEDDAGVCSFDSERGSSEVEN